MSDFLPSDMTTVKIEPGDYFEFFFDTILLYTYVRGAFFTAGSKETSSIDVYIVGPRNQKIKQFYGKDEAIIRFNTGKYGPGTFSFVFSNKRNTSNAQTVTIAMHTGEDDPYASHLAQGKEIMLKDPEWRKVFLIDNPD